MPDTPRYVGRFAPSPTGPLHWGSLYTALASFLDARAQQGKWLLRIDDLDTPRNAPDAVDTIFATLEAYGLQWDGSVYFQSEHLQTYQSILDTLQHRQLVYPCCCSRKTLATQTAEITGTEAVYPNYCRNNAFPCDTPHALRIKTYECLIAFTDRLQGAVSHHFTRQHGDFVVKRKDHIVAYQFAVVIDDDQQGVNHVVRGMDLLDSTPKQIYLQRQLGLATPHYLHVPVINDTQGFKLSKQTHAQAVDLKSPTPVIFKLLHLLKQQPPQVLHNAPVTELLDWAITHWNPAALQLVRSISLEN